jgi:SPP1 family predicted phage head-tail adaptor
MQSGKLRHRLAIQAPTAVVGSDGTPATTYATTSTVWAQIVPTQGIERFSEGNVNGDITHEITIRGGTTVTRRHRLIYNSRTFEVTSVADSSERGIMTKILAKEVV